MFNSLRNRARSIALIGISAALVVGGVAAAQSNGGEGSQQTNPSSGKRMPPPGMPMGPFGKDLTYAQVHVQNEGKAEVVRLDNGEIVSASDSSITLKENDGNEVAIAVDGDTTVLSGPGKTAAVGDLEEGQEVLVSGPEGGAAQTIMLPPKKGDMGPPPGMGSGYAGAGPPQMKG